MNNNVGVRSTGTDQVVNSIQKHEGDFKTVKKNSIYNSDVAYVAR